MQFAERIFVRIRKSLCRQIRFKITLAENPYSHFFLHFFLCQFDVFGLYIAFVWGSIIIKSDLIPFLFFHGSYFGDRHILLFRKNQFFSANLIISPFRPRFFADAESGFYAGHKSCCRRFEIHFYIAFFYVPFDFFLLYFVGFV